MKLKNKQLASIFQAIGQLDGLQKNSADSKAVVFVPFKFSSKVTLAKTKNLRILRLEAEELEKTRLDLVAQFAGERDKAVPVDKTLAFTKEYEKLLEAGTDDLPLTPFTPAELNLFDLETNPAGNNIASTILEALGALLNDGSQAEPAASVE